MILLFYSRINLSNEIHVYDSLPGGISSEVAEKRISAFGGLHGIRAYFIGTI